MLEMDKTSAPWNGWKLGTVPARPGGGRYDLNSFSDYSLPSFDGLHCAVSGRGADAVRCPSFCISGTIGEEAAIESLRNGATDYVLKQRPNACDLNAAALRRFETAAAPAGQEALREREEFFRLISETYGFDRGRRSRRKTRLQQSFLRGPSGHPQKVAGDRSFEEIHPEDRERIRRSFAEWLHGVGQRAEFRFCSKSAAFATSNRKSARCGTDTQGDKRHCRLRDVTERENAQEQIREQAALLDKAQDAICVTDMEQRILSGTERRGVVWLDGRGSARPVRE